MREKDDETIGVGDLGEAGLFDESVADILARLSAAVERHMDAAAGLRLAAGRHIDHALVSEAVTGIGERRLVKHDELTLRLGERGWSGP